MFTPNDLLDSMYYDKGNRGTELDNFVDALYNGLKNTDPTGVSIDGKVYCKIYGINIPILEHKNEDYKYALRRLNDKLRLDGWECVKYHDYTTAAPSPGNFYCVFLEERLT
jgi:hypothetical protein